MSTAGQGDGGQKLGRPRVLAGRYRLDEVIGRGGMSTVYRGTDLALDRVVAVKVALDPLAEENPVYVARFKREARAAAALTQPGVATVFDAGSDGATRFIVMEYVDGRSLSEVLRDEGPLEPRRAAFIAEQVADTLAAAHAAGIVHRDIKPGNVMITRGGPPGSPDADREHVKVLDFGIARTADAVTLTQTASVLGTAPYMAPEQAMGQPADARSDIYSLGCVLYEMLTGKPPFTGDMPAAVLHQHVRVAAKPPSERNPAVPPALDALVVEMLAKKPEDRPQTAAEVRDRLAAVATDPPTAPTEALATDMPTAPTEAMAPGDGLPPAVEALAVAAAAAADVPQVATVPQAGTIPPQASAPTRKVQPPPRRPRRAPWALLAALCVLLLGGAVALALSGGASSSKTSSASTGASTHHSTAAPTQQSTSAPPSTSTPNSASSSSSTTPTTATATVTTTTTATPPGPTGGAPPGQGGQPPGQAKKKDKKGP